MDGLVKREITPGEMVEHFEKRDDRLFFRKVVYTKPTKKFEPAEKDRSKQIQVSFLLATACSRKKFK